MPSNLPAYPSNGQWASLDRLTTALLGGGDTRLQLHANQLNGYGCQPCPRPDEISFASSTASTISERGFAAAQAALSDFPVCDPHREFGEAKMLAERVRHDLKTLLELDRANDVILSPSGTDAALIAFVLSKALLARPIVSVIAAADESGAGVSLAASGRHFSSIASSGRNVTKGTPLAGLPGDTITVQVSARNREGNPKPPSDVDAEVSRAVGHAVRQGYAVVLYAMDHSKTGLRCPSRACLQQLTAAYADAVQIVIDACQSRLSRPRLREHLASGSIVLLTGSKFFTGPPLSGALLLPANMRLVTIERCEGLADYSSQHDWPERWSATSSRLPSRANLGQLLRWVAAIEEMRAYFNVPELYRKVALRDAAAILERSIQSDSGVRLLEHEPSSDEDGADELAHRTIYSFTVKGRRGPLTMAQSRILYRALNEDMSGPLGIRGADAELAATPCHIGQPVVGGHGADGDVGALRMSIDARLLTRLWTERGSSAETPQHQTARAVQTVLDKLNLLSDRFPEIERALGAQTRVA